MAKREIGTYWRKWTVDVGMLDHIDSEEKAYMMGFIAADGDVDRDRLSFTLHRRDVNILQRILAILGSNHPIADRPRDRVAVYIGSRPLVRRLAELGIVPAKTFTIQPPTEIPDALMPHWLRGYWDGDGWICEQSRRLSGTEPRVGVAGWSASMMAFIQHLCSLYAAVDVPMRPNGRGGWQINMAGLRARTWLQTVYLPATIALDRKLAEAKRLCAMPNSTREAGQHDRRRREYIERYAARNAEMRRLREEGWKLGDIGAKYGLKIAITSSICLGRRGERELP